MHVNVYVEMFSLTRTIHMQEMLTCFFRTPFCLCLMSAASDYEYRDVAMESVFFDHFFLEFTLLKNNSQFLQ
jgi:hypothetical protein